jgi:hypothetical protein
MQFRQRCASWPYSLVVIPTAPCRPRIPPPLAEGLGLPLCSREITSARFFNWTSRRPSFPTNYTAFWVKESLTSTPQAFKLTICWSLSSTWTKCALSINSSYHPLNLSYRRPLMAWASPQLPSKKRCVNFKESVPPGGSYRRHTCYQTINSTLTMNPSPPADIPMCIWGLFLG